MNFDGEVKVSTLREVGMGKKSDVYKLVKAVRFLLSDFVVLLLFARVC